MDAPENAKRPTWPKSQHCHHCVRLLVAAFIVNFVVLLWVLAFHVKGSARSGVANTEVNWSGRRCSSHRCKETARLLKSFRSNHTSPCVDFYEHVCAGVQDTPETSAGSASQVFMRQLATTATTNIVRHALAQRPPRLQQSASEKASAFLRMCKDRALHHEENLSALRSYTEASGLFHEDADFNPLVKIAEHLFVLGLPVFYQVVVDDAFVWKRSRPFTIEISAATVLWLQTKKNFSSQVGYTNHVMRMLLEAGVQTGRSEALSVAIAGIEDVVHAAHSQYLAQKEGNSRIFIVRLVEQASLFSNDTQTMQEWSEFVGKKVTMGHTSPVYVFIEEATTNFFNTILNKLSDAELRTLISWEVLRDIVIASGAVPFTDLYTQWYCIQNTLRIYGHGLTVPYYQSFVTSKKLRKIGNMYANIKYYLMKITNTSWWLQEPSRNVTTEYIRRLKTRIIFPHTLESKNDLDEHYSSWPDVRFPFLATYLIASRAHAKASLAFATSLYTRLSPSDPRKFVAMAVYNRKTNALFLSGSSTFTSALDSEGPVEVSYGFLGRILAQGFMRVFASFTDGEHWTSRHNDLWMNDTRRYLQELALCLAEQANELEESSAEYNHKLRQLRSAAWTKAHGEASPVPLPVVLEVLGLVPLYEAYVDTIKYDPPFQPVVLSGLEDLSEEQLFFFAWCYSLCSGERTTKSLTLDSLRCNLAVANQVPFINTFACNQELPMNPVKKCPLW